MNTKWVLFPFDLPSYIKLLFAVCAFGIKCAYCVYCVYMLSKANLNPQQQQS